MLYFCVITPNPTNVGYYNMEPKLFSYHISKTIEIFFVKGFDVSLLFLPFSKFRIIRNYKICSLLRRNLYMGPSQVPGEATALGLKMDIERMEMDQ